MKSAHKKTAAIIFCSLAAVLCSCASYNESGSIDLPVQISFSWWGNETRSNYTLKGIIMYEKEREDIDILPSTGAFDGYKQTLDVNFAANKQSDVMQINYSWLAEYSPDGCGFYDLYELSDYVDLDNFTEEELSYGVINGKLNAIPVSLNALTFYYNEDMFKEYGLSIPETWDDLFSCAEVFSADGIYTLETADIYSWLMLVAHEEQITGEAIYSENGELNFGVSNFMSMMEFYRELLNAGVFEGSYSRDRFLSGESAGEALWTSDAEYYAAPLETEYGHNVIIGDYLTLTTALRSGWYVKPTSLYCISSTCEAPEEAARFLNFLLNNETMAQLQGTEKGVPLSDSALETLSAKDMLNGAAAEASRKLSDAGELTLMPGKLEDSEFYSRFFERFDLYYYGEATLEEAAEELVLS